MKYIITLIFLLTTTVINAQPEPDRNLTTREVTEFTDDEIWHKNMELICPVNFDQTNQANEMVEFTRINTNAGDKYIYAGSFNEVATTTTYIRIDDLTNPRSPLPLTRKLTIENDNGNVELGPMVIWTSDSNNIVYGICTIRNNNEIKGLSITAKAIIVNLTELMNWGEEDIIIKNLNTRLVEKPGSPSINNTNIYIGYIESIRDFFKQANCDSNKTEDYRKIHTLTLDKKSSAMTFNHLCNSAYFEDSKNKTDAFVDLFMLEGVTGYNDFGIETHTNYNSTNLISLARLTKDGKPIRVTRDAETTPTNWPTTSAVHETHAHRIKKFDTNGNPIMETETNKISLNVACTSSSIPGSECNKDSLELYDMEGGYGIVDVDYSDPDNCVVTFQQWINGDPDRINPNVRNSPDTFGGSDGWSANVGHTIEPIHIDLKNHFFVTISELATPTFAELINGDAWLQPYELLTSDVNGAYAGLGTIALNDNNGIFDDRRLSNTLKIWGGDRGHHFIRGVGSENKSNPSQSTWNTDASGPLAAYDVLEQSPSDRANGNFFPTQHINDIDEIDCSPTNTERAPNTMHHIRTYFGTTGVLPDENEDFRLRSELFVGAYAAGTRVIDIKNFIRTDDIGSDITYSKDTIFEAAYFDYFPTLSYDKDSRYFYSRTTLGDYDNYEFKYGPDEISIQNFFATIFDSYPDSRRPGLEDDEDFVYAWGGFGAKQAQFLQYGGYLVLRYFRDEIGGIISGNNPSNPIKYQDRVFRKVNLQGDFKVQRDVTIASGAEVWLLPGEEGSGKTHDNMEFLVGDNGEKTVYVDGTLHVSLEDGNNGGSHISIEVPIEVRDGGKLYIHNIRDNKERIANITKKITVHEGGVLEVTENAKVIMEELFVDDGGVFKVEEGAEITFNKDRHHNYGIARFEGTVSNPITVSGRIPLNLAVGLDYSELEIPVQLFIKGGTDISSVTDQVFIENTIFKGVHVSLTDKNILSIKNNKFYDKSDEDYAVLLSNVGTQLNINVSPDKNLAPEFFNLTVENNEFEDKATTITNIGFKKIDGFKSNGNYLLTLKNNVFKNLMYGATIGLARSCLVEGNIFDEMINGLHLFSTGGRVCNNEFEENHISMFYNKSNVFTVYDNEFTAVGFGSKAIDGVDQRLRNNKFANFYQAISEENSTALLRGTYNSQSQISCSYGSPITLLGRNIFCNGVTSTFVNPYLQFYSDPKRCDIYLKYKEANVVMDCGYNNMALYSPKHVIYDKEVISDPDKTLDGSYNQWNDLSGYLPRTTNVMVVGNNFDVSSLASTSCSIGESCPCTSTGVYNPNDCLTSYSFTKFNFGDWIEITRTDSADTYFDDIYQFYYTAVDDVSLTGPCRVNFANNLLGAAVYGDSSTVKVELVNSLLNTMYLDTNYSIYERIHLGYVLAEGYERVGEIDSAEIVLANIKPIDTQVYTSRADWDLNRLTSIQHTDQDSIDYYYYEYQQDVLERIKIRFDTSGYSMKKVKEVNGNGELIKNELYGNEPNPFNGKTKISYFLVEDDNIKITIINETGKLVLEAYEGVQSKGKHSLELNLQNLTSGVYFYILETSQGKLMEKMYLIK